MEKKLSSAIEGIPALLKEAADIIKCNVSEQVGDDLLASGSILSIMLKLIINPVINKIKEKESKDKLYNYGINTYFKASYIQALKSVEKIKQNNNQNISKDKIIKYFAKDLEESAEKYQIANMTIIFQPKYHPLVIYVRSQFENMLRHFGITETSIFIKNFNDNIEETIKKEFGIHYKMHLENTQNYLLIESEAKLLSETISLNKIGFNKDEYLKYEKTMGYWCEAYRLENPSGIKEKEDKFSKDEENLKDIETIIDNYFNESPEDHIRQILFIIADFGKGKSVFMKQFASRLAKEYNENRSGYFPVYFNLKEYKTYKRNSPLGVIDDYLIINYKINIQDNYFKNRKYYFLIDSLDENGELNTATINKVVNSIKLIQNIDRLKYLSNRIVITSRPINDCLVEIIKNNSPHMIMNSEEKNVPCFASIYGFTKAQFNDWLHSCFIMEKMDLDEGSIELIKTIVNDIGSNKITDIHKMLINSKSLSEDELKRPIFAYMLYQLLINNINIYKLGKIGIYLSFLNLLTKEAKYIKDIDCNFNLENEFIFRDLLHSISALWMYKRQQGDYSILNKADIYRVIEGKVNTERDEDILRRYIINDILKIKFLSHSFFGENEEKLYFPHQSFAEILLAEYYLKIIIKYALDDDANIDDAKSKLVLGIPTPQTLNFLVELVNLIKESSIETQSSRILEKRKLLFPLLASLSVNINLKCNKIYEDWFSKIVFTNSLTEYPTESLLLWPIRKPEIDKILTLCSKILNSKDHTLLTKAEVKNSLFNGELLLIRDNKLQHLCYDIDKWLALLIGNNLYNDFSNNDKIKLFNTDFNIKPQSLFDLISSLTFSIFNAYRSYELLRQSFVGIDMRGYTSKIVVEDRNINNFDFSYSYFENISIRNCSFSYLKFNNCSFHNVEFSESKIAFTLFKNIINISNCSFYDIMCDQYYIATLDLVKYLQLKHKYKSIYITSKQNDYSTNIKSLLYFIKPFIDYYSVKGEITNADIKKIIKFKDQKSGDLFYNNIKKKE